MGDPHFPFTGCTEILVNFRGDADDGPDVQVDSVRRLSVDMLRRMVGQVLDEQVPRALG